MRTSRRRTHQANRFRHVLVSPRRHRARMNKDSNLRDSHCGAQRHSFSTRVGWDGEPRAAHGGGSEAFARWHAIARLLFHPSHTSCSPPGWLTTQAPRAILSNDTITGVRAEAALLGAERCAPDGSGVIQRDDVDDAEPTSAAPRTAPRPRDDEVGLNASERYYGLNPFKLVSPHHAREACAKLRRREI